MPYSSLKTTHPLWEIPPAGGVAVTRVSVLPSTTTGVALGFAAVVAVLAPWLVHIAPVEGTPLGPILLPIFYAPLLAALLLRLPMAVAVSVAAPIASRLLTGMPADPVLLGIVLQVALFVVAIRIFRSYHWLVVVPIAYVASLLAAALVTAMIPSASAVDITGTIQMGWPGLAILTGFAFLAQRTLR